MSVEQETPFPKSSLDDIIAIYQKDVDISLILENLKLTPGERVAKLERFMEFIEECHHSGEKLRRKRAE